MQDKTTLGISDTFREFIEALVEEVVINGEPFDAQKKWLRKYSEAEGLNYETIESNLNDLFEAIKELEEHESKVIERSARALAKDCYLDDATVNKLIDYAAAVRTQIGDAGWASVFCEQLRLAYCNKDMAFLEKSYTPNAQVTTGAFDTNTNQIRYRAQGYQQYMANLRYIFSKNKAINVRFETDSLTGVLYVSADGRWQLMRLLQQWQSDRYSDRGYLLLLLCIDQTGPKVHIRVWQPEYLDNRHITAQELYGVHNIQGLP